MMSEETQYTKCCTVSCFKGFCDMYICNMYNIRVVYMCMRVLWVAANDVY